MVEFTNGDVKVLKSGTVFKESARNPSIRRLLGGKRPRLRKLSAAEITYHGLGEDDLVVVLDSAN
jgi:hypothetical protein